MTLAVIRPSQPQSIGEVLDTSFRLYRASIGKVWGLCLLIVVGSLPSTIYMFAKGGMPTPNPANPMAALAIFQDPGYWMAYLFSMVLMLVTVGALYLKQNAIGSGAELSVAQAIQQALGKIVTLLIMSILFLVAVSVGLVLLVIPGLVLMISLMPSYTIALVEDRGPLQSLSDSHALVWGNWWRTSTILTVAFIIVLVFYMAVGFVIGMIAPFIVNPASGAMFGMVTGLLVGVVANVVMMPFTIALLLAIYWDLKLRKHGGDLAARVGALGTA